MTDFKSKNIHVACAVIERNSLVLAAQRSAVMSLPLKWEFPGGKMELGESLEECLCREIVEELGVKIESCRPLQPARHEYLDVTVTLHPFICSIATDEITVNEHAAVVWLPPDQLHELDWAEADLPVLATYCRQLKEERG